MTEDLIYSCKYKNYTIKIFVDKNGKNPREEATLTKICFSDYQHPLTDISVRDSIGVTFDQHKEIKYKLHEIYDIDTIKPLYLYQSKDGKFSLSLHLRNTESETLKESGFIFITEKDLSTLINHKITQKTTEVAEYKLQRELKEYNLYLSGDIYYSKLIHPSGNILNGDSILGDYHPLIETSKNRIDWELKDLPQYPKSILQPENITYWNSTIV